MEEFIKILIFIAFLSTAKSQSCIRPTLMTGFKLSEYGSGTWYSIAGKATMNTPLTAACSRGTCNNNGTFLLVDAESTVNGQTQTIQIVAKAVSANGVFSWYIPQYVVGLMTINDLRFTYYVLYYDSTIACVYITGTIQKVMSINIVMIQARTPTISDTDFNRALKYFSKCRLGTSKWIRIDQTTECPQ